MSTPAVVVVTVNFKTSELACRAMDSVADQRKDIPGLTMIVVDNHSEDGSSERLRAHARECEYDWVTVIASPTNGGFAAGNNVAIRHLWSHSIPFDFIWLLNPDAVALPGAGRALIDFMTQHQVHIAGSSLEDSDGTRLSSSFNFPSPVGELCRGMRLGFLDRLLEPYRPVRPFTDEPERCDWASGASLMMQREVIERVGLMDEKFFLYFEEIDYCNAARKLGFECWHVPRSRVIHELGASTKISDHRRCAPRRPSYWFDSRRRYFLKHEGSRGLALSDSLFLVGYTSWLVRARLTGKHEELAHRPPFFLRDSFRHSFLRRGFGLERE